MLDGNAFAQTYTEMDAQLENIRPPAPSVGWTDNNKQIMNNRNHTVVKTAGVNCEFDTDNVNISAMTSPSSSNMADSMAADDPL